MIGTEIDIINKFKILLVKLGIKSARVSTKSMFTGAGAVLKINGKPIAFAQGVTYDYNNIRDLTDDGSND